MNQVDSVDVLHRQLSALLDQDAASAVAHARGINVTADSERAMRSLKAVILVDGGAECGDVDAISEGLEILKELYLELDDAPTTYNLANAYANSIGRSPEGESWLDHKELHRRARAEARRLFSRVSDFDDVDPNTLSQSYANLGNQLSDSYRFSEAHDARLAAVRKDPSNGVAAGNAAMTLIRLYRCGFGTDLSVFEAQLLAQIAANNYDRVVELAGKRAADGFAEVAAKLAPPPRRNPHVEPFLRWVERERLSLAPTVELVDPELKKIDWLQLESITESQDDAGSGPPKVFAMFNTLKSDFVFARDLLWRVVDEQAWPETASYTDTLDYATYGPHSSALVVAHNKAIDILDKVGVVANHYFGLGAKPDKIYFKDMWRVRGKQNQNSELLPTVDETIRRGVLALYGLVEIADDLLKDGMLESHLKVRHAGTHRFVVLHDIGSPEKQEQIDEVAHYPMRDFVADTCHALRVCRSAIQILALAIKRNEDILARDLEGQIGRLYLPDHDWVRGRD